VDATVDGVDASDVDAARPDAVPTCGAAAAVLCSDEYAAKHNISDPVYIAA
jgi:hypothetical protein